MLESNHLQAADIVRCPDPNFFPRRAPDSVRFTLSSCLDALQPLGLWQVALSLVLDARGRCHSHWPALYVFRDVKTIKSAKNHDQTLPNPTKTQNPY